MFNHEPIHRSRSDQARQQNSILARETFSRNQSCSCSDPSLPHFQDAGLSVCSSSTARKKGPAHSRIQNRFYRQASLKHCAALKATVQTNGRIAELYGVQSISRFSQRNGAWIEKTIPNKSRRFTVSTGCRTRNFLKSMSCWFPIQIFQLNRVQMGR